MEYIDALLVMLNSMSPYLVLGFLIAGVLHAFVPSAVYSRFLAGTGVRSVVTAAAIGVPLPLCSCGVLPTAVSLRRNGASRAATTSFLIATPQTGVDSIAATYSMMGLPFAILRPIAALVTAMLGGTVLGALESRGKLDGENSFDEEQAAEQQLPPTLLGKVVETLRYGLVEMMQNIGKWLVLGLVVATLITVWVPDDFFTTYANNHFLNMLVVVAVAVPMYVCATGSIPIAAALMMKGLSPGCALVMLMAGPAANVASMLVVGRAMGRRAAAVYLLSIVAGAMGFGLLIDYWPGMQELFTSAMPECMKCHHSDVSWINIACSILLVVMIAWGFIAKYRKSYLLTKNKTQVMKEFKINGMMCNHCKMAVEKGLATVEGVEKVTVDLAKGVAYVEGTATDEAIKAKVTALGYENA
ncbi:MAG: SO_0444 family Cu/Zn efflux transporter [Muribaculaceae bacterium]|nr:SO_0444 family Cu/Zn efflux transporter [Muribaculaceae bacterium]